MGEKDLKVFEFLILPLCYEVPQEKDCSMALKAENKNKAPS
jgi:hypothetical protein